MRKCPICGKELNGVSLLRPHLLKEHRVGKIDLLIYLSKENVSMSCIRKLPEEVARAYLAKLDEINGLSKRYDGQFYSAYKHISYVRTFDLKVDIDLFFKKILPWKLKHPCQTNNRELAKLEADGNEEQEEKIYRYFMLEKNPYYKHDGSMSPWSKDFVNYKDMSEEEKKKAIRKAIKCETKTYNTRLSYYLDKGFTEKEAKEKQKTRQQTFNLEKCIAKYGEEKGYEVWKKRQEIWQHTLQSKPIEELIEINRKKASAGIGNREETEFLMNVLPDKKYHNVYIRKIAIGDLVYENKIIEFYGDYWHCNPTIWKPDDFQKTLGIIAKERWETDRIRQNKLEALGYKVKIVWEKDYNQDKEKVIKECKEFLGVN